MKTLKKIINVLFALSLVLFGISYFFRNTLPDSSQVLSELYTAPQQEEVKGEPVILEKEDYKATIEPLYSYEIYGLVVTLYDSDIWYDQMHKDDPFNTKDLCVVWGENAKSGIYQKGQYRHGEFTCYWRFKNQNDWQRFSQSEASNNHLIPANDSLFKEIKKANIGDQVYIRGYLSNYEVAAEGRQIFTRGTSTTREDTGNHACETVYVTDFEILRKNNSIFLLIFVYGRYVVSLLLVLIIILFFVDRKAFSSDKE